MDSELPRYTDFRSYLFGDCTRLKYGDCRTLGCVLRGGWDGKSKPVDCSVATCVPYEIAKELRLI